MQRPISLQEGAMVGSTRPGQTDTRAQIDLEETWSLIDDSLLPSVSLHSADRPGWDCSQGGLQQALNIDGGSYLVLPPTLISSPVDTVAISMLPDQTLSTGAHESPQAVRSVAGYSSGLTTMVPLTLFDRLLKAVVYISQHFPEYLVQVWMPVMLQTNTQILTTRDQPFSHGDNDDLKSFRSASEKFEYNIKAGSTVRLDLQQDVPGRVFIQQVPEWSPNVQMYSSLEYSRFFEAQQCGIRGSLNLPVYDPATCQCVAVMELVGGIEKELFNPDVEIVSKALQMISLSSVTGLKTPVAPEKPSQARQFAYEEITKVLTFVCETHKLPFAQTWMPVSTYNSKRMRSHDGSSSSRSPSGSCSDRSTDILRTCDGPCYIRNMDDQFAFKFCHVCREHSLGKGQGVPGKAFESHNQEFDSNVTNHYKAEYPLGHYARWFGLGAAVAFPIQITHTSGTSGDFILEFFFPPACKKSKDQELLLESLSITMQATYRSFQVSRVGIDKSEVEVAEELDDEDWTMDPHTPTGMDELRNVGDESQNSKLGKRSLERAKRRKSLPISRRPIITLEMILPLFEGNMKDAAKALNVCPGTLTKILEEFGINKWPGRHLRATKVYPADVQKAIKAARIEAPGVQQGTALPEVITTVAVAAPDHTSEEPLCAQGNRAGELEQQNEGSGDTLLPKEGDRRERDSSSPQVVNITQATGKGVNVTQDHASKDDSCAQGNRSALAAESEQQNVGSPGDAVVPEEDDRREQKSCSPQVVSIAQATGKDACVTEDGETNASCAQGLNRSALVLEQQSVVAKVTGKVYDSQVVNIAHEVVGNIFKSATPHAGSSAAQRPKDCSSPSTPDLLFKVTYGKKAGEAQRFRLSSDKLTYLQLREEIAERVQLQELAFELHFLDEDKDWISLASDGDLQECILLMRASTENVIRLQVVRRAQVTVPRLIVLK